MLAASSPSVSFHTYSIQAVKNIQFKGIACLGELTGIRCITLWTQEIFVSRIFVPFGVSLDLLT